MNIPAPSETSYHDAEGNFCNPPGSPKRQSTRADMRKFLFDGLTGRRNNSPDVPREHVLSDSDAAKGWDARQGDKLQWLGHSAFRWKLDDTVLISDPLLTDRASPFSFIGPKRYVPSPLKPEQAAADIVLISHNHYDHLDLRTLARLPNKETVQVIVPLGNSASVRSAGISNVIELDWHQSITIRDLKITLLPAIHFSARWTNDRNKTLWGGYAVESSQHKIYMSGDTAYHPDAFKKIGERYGPFDYGLIAIGAYEPRSIMIASHVTPEEAVQIGRDVKAKTLVGHHWGALVLTPENPFEPPVRFKAAAKTAGYPDQDTWIMKVGETRAF
ncbi:MAG: MBL fold metallo-hydrolase [Pseudomonadota bacterium]